MQSVFRELAESIALGVEAAAVLIIAYGAIDGG
jgi:hypothetical protein